MTVGTMAAIPQKADAITSSPYKYQYRTWSPYKYPYLNPGVAKKTEVFGVDDIVDRDKTYHTYSNSYGSFSGDSGKKSTVLSGAETSWGKNSVISSSKIYTIYGNSNAWSYTGKKINFRGKKAEPAYIRFKGNYLIAGVPLTGEVSYKVYISVYDLTSKSELGGVTIEQNSDSLLLLEKTEGTIGHSTQIVLQPGHSYLCKVGVETSASSLGSGAIVRAGARLDSVQVDLINY